MSKTSDNQPTRPTTHPSMEVSGAQREARPAQGGAVPSGVPSGKADATASSGVVEINDTTRVTTANGRATVASGTAVSGKPIATQGGVAGSPSAVGATGAKPEGHPGNPTNLGEQKKRDRKYKVIAGVIAGVIVVVIGALIWLFAAGGASSMFDSNAQEGQAPYKTKEEIQEELNRIVEEGMFNISIASLIEFENGQAEADAWIENVPGNPYNMQVTITEDANPDRVLYESGAIKPNSYIQKIKLNDDLEPGEYPCTATFKALDPETNEEVGQAAAKVTIAVMG